MDGNAKDGSAQVSLCEALDRLLTKGVVLNGDLVVSVAGVELLYVGLRGLICGIDSLDQRPASLSSRWNPVQTARVEATDEVGHESN
ncbi:gas vesicle protein [Pirellulaceae bacterium SH501]